MHSDDLKPKWRIFFRNDFAKFDPSQHLHVQDEYCADFLMPVGGHIMSLFFFAQNGMEREEGETRKNLMMWALKCLCEYPPNHDIYTSSPFRAPISAEYKLSPALCDVRRISLFIRLCHSILPNESAAILSSKGKHIFLLRSSFSAKSSHFLVRDMAVHCHRAGHLACNSIFKTLL